MSWFSPTERAASRAYHRPLHRCADLVGAADLAVVPAVWLVTGADERSLVALSTAGALLALARAPHRRGAEGWRELVHERRHRSDSIAPAVVALTMALRVVADVAITASMFAGAGLLSGFAWPVAAALGLAAGLAGLASAALLRRFGPRVIDRARPLRPEDDGHGLGSLVASADGGAPVALLVGQGRLAATGEGAYVSGRPSQPVIVVDRALLDGPGEVARAVVAHELGHLRLGHLGGRPWWVLVVVGIPVIAALFGPLSARQLLLADAVLRAVGPVLGAVSAARSRRLEAEADAFAARTVGGPDVAGAVARWFVRSGIELDPDRRGRRRARYPPAELRLDVLARSPVSDPRSGPSATARS